MTASDDTAERQLGREAPSTCKYCGCCIWWSRNANDKWVTTDFDERLHFETCVAKRKVAGGTISKPITSHAADGFYNGELPPWTDELGERQGR